MNLENIKTYWIDNSELNMKEFHYNSDGLVFIGYYTSDDKLAFVFNNTSDNLHSVKKLVINPLKSEVNFENPIIKWDQILKEEFDIDPVSIRPKNGNLYERFDIDYVGLDKYEELIKNPENGIIRNNLIIFDVRKNLDHAYKKEEETLIELNASSKTVETTTKTLEKIDTNILNLNKRIEKINLEPANEDTEEKKLILNEKLYKKLADQKNAKRRLKRAKSRYIKSNRVIENIRSLISNATDFLKKNKEVIVSSKNILDGDNKNVSKSFAGFSTDKVIAGKEAVMAVEGKNNNVNLSDGKKNGINFSVPNWKKQDSSLLGKDENKDPAKGDNKSFDSLKPDSSNISVNDSNNIGNINDKLKDIKNKIIEKSSVVMIKGDSHKTTTTKPIVKSFDDNNHAWHKNKIIIGTLGDYSSNLDKQSNAMYLKKYSMNSSTAISENFKHTNNNEVKKEVFRYSSNPSVKVINAKDDKLRKNIIYITIFAIMLGFILAWYFVSSKKTVESDRLYQNTNIPVQDNTVIEGSMVDENKDKKDAVFAKKEDRKIKIVKSVRMSVVKKNNIKKDIKDSKNNKLMEKKKRAIIDDKKNKETKEIEPEKADDIIVDESSVIHGENTDNSGNNDVTIKKEDDVHDTVTLTSENNDPADILEQKNVDVNIADASLALSSNAMNDNSKNDDVDKSDNSNAKKDDIANPDLIPDTLKIDAIKYDKDLISARDQYVSGVIGYMGSVNRALDIMMALGEAIVNQDDNNVQRYIVEVNKMNILWNNFRQATINSYYRNDDIHILKDGIVENSEIYDLFIDDEKLLRVYSDAHQTLFLIVRYMLDNYKDSVDSDLFDKVKEYASTPEMLGYPVLKTKLIMDAYKQVYGQNQIKSDVNLPTNEQVNSIYSDDKSTINTKQKIILTNTNDSSDVIEKEIELNDISPNKEYKIKMGVEKKKIIDKKSSKVEEYDKIININIEAVDDDAVKGTSVFDKSVNYKNGEIDTETPYIIKRNNEEEKITTDKSVSGLFVE